MTTYVIDSGPRLAAGGRVAADDFFVGVGVGVAVGVGVSVAEMVGTAVGGTIGGKVASGGSVLTGGSVGDAGTVDEGAASGAVGPPNEHARLIAINIINAIDSGARLRILASLN